MKLPYKRNILHHIVLTEDLDTLQRLLAEDEEYSTWLNQEDDYQKKPLDYLDRLPQPSQKSIKELFDNYKEKINPQPIQAQQRHQPDENPKKPDNQLTEEKQNETTQSSLVTVGFFTKKKIQLLYQCQPCFLSSLLKIKLAHNQNILHYAIQTEDLAMLNWVLQQPECYLKPDMINQKDDYGKSPYDYLNTQNSCFNSFKDLLAWYRIEDNSNQIKNAQFYIPSRLNPLFASPYARSCLIGSILYSPPKNEKNDMPTKNKENNMPTKNKKPTSCLIREKILFLILLSFAFAAIIKHEFTKP